MDRSSNGTEFGHSGDSLFTTELSRSDRVSVSKSVSDDSDGTVSCPLRHLSVSFFSCVSGAGGDRVAGGNVFRREASVLMAAQLRACKAQLIYSIAHFVSVLVLSSATDRSPVYNQPISPAIAPFLHQSVNQPATRSVLPSIHPPIHLYTHQSISRVSK